MCIALEFPLCIPDSNSVLTYLDERVKCSGFEQCSICCAFLLCGKTSCSGEKLNVMVLFTGK